MNEERHIIRAAGAPEPVGSYPHARRVGDLLFLSGIGPRTRGEKVIPGVQTDADGKVIGLSLIHISEPTRPFTLSRMPSSA